MRSLIQFLMVPVSVSFLLLSCKKWEDHTTLPDPVSDETLFQVISKRPDLGKFTEYLVKTGLDKELGASKTYTVWAPKDEALKTLDAAIIADVNKLKSFLYNHISGQLYYTSNAQPNLRVPLLNGKRAPFFTNKFDEATITQGDIPAYNGVLHTIDKFVQPLPNAWEWVNSTTAQYKQSAFIATQNFTFQDPSLAIIDSISATTGLPVYRPGTGMVTRNRFNDQVYDLKNEDKLYTFFVLNDAALKTETDSLTGFYKTSTADSTNDLATMAVIKDVIVEGLYTIDQLPAFLTSKFGVTIPVDKNAIIETRRLSNGIVYIVNKLDLLTRQKISNVVVQGENPRGFFRANGDPVNVNTTAFYRARSHPVTGQLFSDLFVYNHGVAALNILYQAFNLPSAKYKVYWVAVNDTLRVNSVVNPVVFQQRLAMGSRTATSFAYSSITINNYNEVYLREYTQSSFGTLNMYLTAANNTTAGTNSVTLDYIRLEPQIN